jgi:hypothetical protein
MAESTSEPYTRHTTYWFSVLGVDLAVTSFTHDSIDFEETRKNGQEDCHIGGTAIRGDDGVWRYEDDDPEEPVARYSTRWDLDQEVAGLARTVLEFFTEHGIPKDDVNDG